MCAILAAGVFVTMFLAIWNSRRTSNGVARFHQTAVAEVVWAAIPCLMVLAAAIPAASAIIAPAPKAPMHPAADNKPASPLTPTESCPQLSGSPRGSHAGQMTTD
jgi:heme/copper-type cytochrome/quinol oxidase subunit 2